MRTRRSRFSLNALLLVALSACGAQRVAVVAVPISLPPDAPKPSDQPDADATAASAAFEYDAPSRDRGKYWSAFAYIDELALLRRWGEHDNDHAFITARVKLPTRDTVITRDFPLYTIKGKSIQSHQGVDLLQKFPLSEAAREQVMISLEVRYLAGAEALDVTRKIIANAEKLAEPYLRNFSIASSIMSSAVALADQLAPKDAGDINSASFSIDPRSLNNVHAYLLIADDLPRLDNSLTTCSDKPGAICRKRGSASARPLYANAAYLDEVYVTLRFESREDVYDPLTLLRGSGTCALIDKHSLAAARDYLRANTSLFVDHDVALAEAAYTYAEQYLRLREGVSTHNFGSLLDVLNEYGNDSDLLARLLRLGGKTPGGSVTTQPEAMLSTVLECYANFWKQTPGKEVLEAWRILDPKERQDIATGAGEGIKRLRILGHVLRRLSGLSGVENWRSDSKNTGTVIELLRGEANSLSAAQAIALRDEITLTAATCTAATRTRLLALFSAECIECASQVTALCLRDQKELTTLQQELNTKQNAEQIRAAEEVQTLTSKPERAGASLPVIAPAGSTATSPDAAGAILPRASSTAPARAAQPSDS